MNGLIDNPGKLRTKSVGIFKGSQVAYIAPLAGNLNHLMKELFKYIKFGDDHILIKSCVAHYEIEFIHPFMDGNGRMGRLWQSFFLLKEYLVLEYLPFETIIKERQQEYYDVLEKSDKEGQSTKFIEFILVAIDESLQNLLNIQTPNLTSKDGIEYFISIFQNQTFTRKDYLNIFKKISSATTSRDLKFAVENKLITKKGDKRMTVYKKK